MTSFSKVTGVGRRGDGKTGQGDMVASSPHQATLLWLRLSCGLLEWPGLSTNELPRMFVPGAVSPAGFSGGRPKILCQPDLGRMANGRARPGVFPFAVTAGHRFSPGVSTLIV